MKAIGITSTAILSLLLGIAAPARAQQEQQGEKQGRPEQQRGGHEQGKPEQQHSQQERQPQHARQQPEHDQQQQNSTPSNNSNSTPSNNSNGTLKNNRINNSDSTLNNNNRNDPLNKSGATNNHSDPSNSSVSSGAPGSGIAPKTGSQTTEHGNNVAATTATASLTTGFVDTSGRTMGSGSIPCPSWSWEDIPASNTTATGSVPLIPGPNTGEMTGTTQTTSMSTTPTTAITYTTADIPPPLE